MQGILRHINFDLVKCIILASPGFVKDQFMDYMIQQAVKSDNKVILENKSKFLLVHASSGFKHSLRGSKYVSMQNMNKHLHDTIVFMLLLCFRYCNRGSG